MAKLSKNRMRQPSPAQLQAVAKLFSVLADPNRLRVLQLLQNGPMTVNEIVTALDAKQANVSKQLAVLYDAGLVARSRQNAFVRYWISEPMIFELCDMVCDKLQRDAKAALKAFGVADV